ncbi:nitrilase-related carbon-nitrogen hydrolase [Oceanidesulfovibrio marinus]|uniref:Nitrilase n=1 Tax=Oceanidesulfovibrio marinus TaxID=370038 RepID=A0ABX6NGA2_9BACT|nr:nitrilase-related carbon-nitrogen hydrolase [Oceanidesulfovibrio marinus]QJT09174.1 nitrilase [Oceanidesulfovibrio marinus]
MAFHLGVCQIPVYQKRAPLLAQLAKALKHLPENENGGTRGLLALPEIFYGGFDYANSEELAAETPSLLADLHAFSRENRVALAGSLWDKGNGGLYNAMYVLDPKAEAPVCVHRKQHLFPQTKEEDHFIPGPIPPTVYEIEGIRFGFAICFEIRFPELFRHQNERGVDCFVVSSQWPLKRLMHISPLLRSRAIENQCFVLSCNGCGWTPLGELAGHSCLISPWGELLFGCHDEEDLRAAPYDSALLERARRLFNTRRSPFYPVENSSIVS